MTDRQLSLLKRLNASEEGSINLTKRDAKIADQLIALGYADLTPKAMGGAWLNITQCGIDTLSPSDQFSQVVDNDGWAHQRDCTCLVCQGKVTS